jgi:nucleotide-binding universal stress UspA family protein
MATETLPIRKVSSIFEEIQKLLCDSVLHSAGCVRQAGVIMKFKRILVPTDFSSNAQVAFNVAYALARATMAELYVFHVAESPLRTAVKENLMHLGISQADIEEAVDELQDVRFAEVTAGLGSDVTMHCHARQGVPQVRIVEFAQEKEADLMVIGLRGRSAANTVRAALMGSVAEAMIRKSPCPVLVVRPDHEGLK